MTVQNGNAQSKPPRRAPGKGPSIMVRFRTKGELKDVRRAAKDKGLSMNTYILTEVLSTARN
ncbi:hypothetical protein, partial [Staphylococcus aureus]